MDETTFDNLIVALRSWDQRMVQSLALITESVDTKVESLSTRVSGSEAALLAVNAKIDTLTRRVDQLTGQQPDPDPEPEPTPDPDPIPDPDPDPEPEPTPDPDPEPPLPTAGIWVSPAEIKLLPTSGAAWTRILSLANGSWGSANLSDNNATHDVKTLAGALVAVRMNDNTMREKVIAGLKSAMVSGLSRTLELSRGLQAYIVAADIIGYRDSAFVKWVADIVVKPLSGHSGGVGILGTAQKSSNNWGGHARASLAAAAIYLDRDDWKRIVVDAQREFIGLPVAKPVMSFTSTKWHADPNQRAGVNRKGTKINGVSVSGVLTEDWRRGGEFKWLPSKSGYIHEGLQGFVATAIILHRAGLMPFNSGDDAVVRAFNMIYAKGEAAANNPVFVYACEGDDKWLTWAVNHYGGTNFPTLADETAGKGIGYAEWLWG